jgi:hypothetical protein
MDGNKEFFILFIPFLLVALGATYVNLNNSLGWIIEGILWFIIIVCLLIDGFALIVQYVNWKYYRGE